MIFYYFHTFRYQSGTFPNDFDLGGIDADIISDVTDIFSEKIPKKNVKIAFPTKLQKKV